MHIHFCGSAIKEMPLGMRKEVGVQEGPNWEGSCTPSRQLTLTQVELDTVEGEQRQAPTQVT